MNIDKYIYKGEFQERGAGHVQGTLWVKMHMIEKLKKLKNGPFITKSKYDRENMTEDFGRDY